jgi:hypothetical protein
VVTGDSETLFSAIEGGYTVCTCITITNTDYMCVCVCVYDLASPPCAADLCAKVTMPEDDTGDRSLFPSFLPSFLPSPSLLPSSLLSLFRPSVSTYHRRDHHHHVAHEHAHSPCTPPSSPPIAALHHLLSFFSPFSALSLLCPLSPSLPLPLPSIILYPFPVSLISFLREARRPQAKQLSAKLPVIPAP